MILSLLTHENTNPRKTDGRSRITLINNNVSIVAYNVENIFKYKALGQTEFNYIKHYVPLCKVTCMSLAVIIRLYLFS